MSMDASLGLSSATNNNISRTSIRGFPGDSQLELPEKLSYLVHYGHLFMLLSGPPGSTERLKEQLVVEFQTFHTVLSVRAEDLDIGNLPNLLLTGFQGERSTKARSDEQLTNALCSYCGQLAQSHRKAILVVSSARGRDAKVLAELMALSEQAGFSLVVFSEKSIASKRTFKPFESQIYAVHLGSMGIFDLKRYIRRTRSGHTELSTHQLESLLNETDRNPARIDELVEGILSEPKRTIGLSMMHMSVIATMLLVFVSAYILSEGDAAKKPVPEQAIEGIVTQMPESPLANQSDTSTGATSVASGVIESESVPKPESSETKTPDEEKTVSPTDVEIANLGTSVNGDPGVITGSSVAISGTRELEVIAPTVPKTANRAPTGKLQSRVSPSPISQKSFAYTLQLVGSKSERAIQALVDEHSGDLALVYFKTRRGSDDWYILTAGQFDSREAALLGVSSLPAALKDMKPWARNVASIQEISN